MFSFAVARSDRSPSMLVSACAVSLALAISACGPVNDDDSTRDETGAVVEGGDVSALRLNVGDCIAEPTEGEFETVPVVPCSEPHVSELFHSFDIDGDDYPGEEEVIALAEAGCIDEFADFIGTSYEESEWDVSFLYPVEETWNTLDDREVLCGVVTVSGDETTGSAEGVAT